jgi:uncharacterized protein (DUF2384 family)
VGSKVTALPLPISRIAPVVAHATSGSWILFDICHDNSDNRGMAEERYFRAQIGGMSLPGSMHQTASRYSEYEQLAARAVEVFGSEIDAARWLSTGSPDFAGRTPLQDLVKQGSSHAIDVLGKIEHGIFF